jgi:hypothetical protein
MDTAQAPAETQQTNENQNTEQQAQGTQAQGDTQAEDTSHAQKPWSELVPDQYKEAAWLTKYSSADEFFKGVENLNKMIGQKQIVQGLQVPAADADENQWNEFFSKAGRPESPEKYELEDVTLPEYFDISEEKKAFSEVAFKAGLNAKQTKELFKSYSEVISSKFNTVTEKTKFDAETAVKEAFGNDPQTGLVLAKKGAKSLGIGDKLDEAGLSSNPLVLKLCAELGKTISEDTLIQQGSGVSKESKLEEALRLQKSPEYMAGDKTVHAKVQELYKGVYG